MKEGGSPGRDFPGKRWAVNLLRAVHLIGVVGLGAGVLGELDAPRWFAFGLTASLSGLLILAIDGWSRPGYFGQYVGLAMVGKLILLAVLLVWPSQRAVLFWSILVFSVLFAHAPARLRHAVWLKRTPR
jgi:hypothetical protein